MAEIVCANCGKQVIAKSKKRRYCSDKCKNDFNHEKNKKYEKTCETCERKFSASYKEARYCCQECRGTAMKEQYGYTLDDVKKVLIESNKQMSIQEIQNSLGCSRNTLYKILNEHELNIEKLHEECGIDYVLGENFHFTSKSAETIFRMLDDYFGIKGIREAMFYELVNPKTSRLLRIDWYSEELNVAVEYNGKQHYVEQKFFNNPLEIIKEKDKLKRDFCHKKGIKLVVIKYNENLSDEDIIKKITL